MYTYGKKPPQWEIGRKLQRAREAAGLTKEQAARSAKSSQSRWRQIEDGVEPIRGEWREVNPTPELLARMCYAVGVPVGEVLPHLDDSWTVDDFDFPLVDERFDLDGLDNSDMPAIQAFIDYLKNRKGLTPRDRRS